MAAAGTEAPRFDPQGIRPERENSSVQKLKAQVKMSINIPASDDSELVFNHLHVDCRFQKYFTKKSGAVHIQVMKIREEDEYLGKDLREGVNPSDRFGFAPMKDEFFRYSKATLRSPLGINAGVRSL